MRRSYVHLAATFVIWGVCALIAGCGSDDSTVEPDTCDPAAVAGFQIDNPQSGHVYVWGGTGRAGAGAMGEDPGFTRLYWPVDVCFDPSGSPIVLDWNNHRVLSVDGGGKLQKMIGAYFGNPDNGPALSANLNHPTHVCFSPDGTKLVLSAWHNSIVMEMDLSTTWIARYGGTGARGYSGEGQARLTTCFDLPVCVAFHPVSGELYFSDQGNHIVRRIDASGNVHVVAGVVPTNTGCVFVGGEQLGYDGDGGAATSARLHLEDGQDADPSGRFCFDAVGNIYIADTDNHAIRIVYDSDGTIDTFAGLGPDFPGHAGDGGPADQARLREPRDVAMDLDGGLLIADTGNHVIRRVAPDGTISTLVGIPRQPVAPALTVPAITVCELQAEHGAPANAVHLTAPYGIEVDGQGNVWISDTENQVIRIFYR